MRIWRICRAPYVAEAFSGEGARRFGGRPFGGRWSSRGVPMVYSSTSLALAAMELFVHLEPGLAPGDLVYLSADLPEGEPGRTVDPADLPPEWWADDTTADAPARELGDAWIRERSSLAMMVPSVPIRVEWNVLLNPAHPRMNELQIEAPQPFLFDARMFQQKQP